MRRIFGSRQFASKINRPVALPNRKTIDYQYYPITRFDLVKQLPYSIRVLLESAIRNQDNFSVTQRDVDTILNWKTTSRSEDADIAFKPARVLLQDFTGVPLVADIASMRVAVKRLGGDPRQVNPLVPIDLVIDHSVQADVARSREALGRNEAIEMERNIERFEFLKWGAQAFGNMRIVPPGNGIVHQVNLEYLSRIVFGADSAKGGLLYPDSCVGTDSHTPMIAGLGVLGWGVGGIEAESVLLGQPISMVIPQVVGVHLTGSLREGVTSTDLVLSVTELMRKKGVVGKFVEFFGEGCSSLSVPTRATIANMAPEYGATVGFFPFDDKTEEYLCLLGRSREFVDTAATYMRANGLSPSLTDATPDYSDIVELDLRSVVPCVAGPKRPQDRIPLTEMKSEFNHSLTAPNGFKGFGVEKMPTDNTSVLQHGSVVLAAITSCTNTSNPGVMIAAGLLAKKARALGLVVPDYVKPVLAPGSKAVSAYLEEAGLLKELEGLGFYIAGYGCMVCIGNTGELDPAVVSEIQTNQLVVASVLSGNRNFEGRIHPLTKANYIASPPLVVAYAIAGRVDLDFETEPIGVSRSGKKIYLKDVWPTQEEIDTVSQLAVRPELFSSVYKNVLGGNAAWDSIKTSTGDLYDWQDSSTYIRQPPYFDNAGIEPAPLADIKNAKCLLFLGDSVTTDHISPAGSIAKNSPAADLLRSHGVVESDFSIYGCRRGNHEIMTRGTFAHVRLINKMVDTIGPKAMHVPSGDIASVFDVASRYQSEGTDAIILAGKEYGTGSSRDWAAKGVQLQGVRAVIAESYERIHRSNLVGMGVLPLQFKAGESAESLGLTGQEEFTIEGLGKIKPGEMVTVHVAGKDDFQALARIDTEVEKEYYTHGGVLLYVMRQILKSKKI